MQVDLEKEQLRLIVDLLEKRIREIHPEIRRSRVYTVHDELQHDLETMQQLSDKLQKLESQGSET